MNLERVQKYYELIDKELGFESYEGDLFGCGTEGIGSVSKTVIKKVYNGFMEICDFVIHYILTIKRTNLLTKFFMALLRFYKLKKEDQQHVIEKIKNKDSNIRAFRSMFNLTLDNTSLPGIIQDMRKEIAIMSKHTTIRTDAIQRLNDIISSEDTNFSIDEFFYDPRGICLLGQYFKTDREPKYFINVIGAILGDVLTYIKLLKRICRAKSKNIFTLDDRNKKIIKDVKKIQVNILNVIQCLNTTINTIFKKFRESNKQNKNASEK